MFLLYLPYIFVSIQNASVGEVCSSRVTSQCAKSHPDIFCFPRNYAVDRERKYVARQDWLVKASTSRSLTYAIGTFPEVLFLPSDRCNPPVMLHKNGKFHTVQLGFYTYSLIQSI